MARRPTEPNLYEVLRDCLRAEQPVALATVVASRIDASGDQDHPHLGAKTLVRPGSSDLGTLGSAGLDSVVGRDALGALESGHSGLRHYGWNGVALQNDVTVFIEVFSPSPKMLILGAVDFSAALASVAKVLGYHVVVCDARAVFATRARLRAADEVVVEWPDRYLAKEGPELGPRDAICVLTHDTKFDVPAIIGALATDVGYIGAMGSRRTKQRREELLVESGVTEEELARVHAPIGLDIGARTPEETAISICAEIIARRTRTARVVALSESTGPIHRLSDAP